VAESSGEKTEQPTPRKMQEARKKGQVAKSKDLSAAIILMAAVAVAFFLCQSLVNNMGRHLTSYFINCFSLTWPDRQLPWVLVNNMYQILLFVAPVFLIIVVMAVLANVMQTGFLVAPESLGVKLERINPLQGLKKIFSVTSLVELLKSILKIVIVGVVSYLVAVKYIPVLLVAYYKSPAQEITEIATVLLVLCLAGGGAYLILALGDYYYQRYDYHKNLRMTKQEVKDEYKQTEGDPQIKGWLRRRQREVAMNQIRQEVPKATVVVTNPIHYAVALRYDEGVTPAPLVVAKGAGDIAQSIKLIATASNVPVIQNPPLARSLFQQIDIGREIPVELYQAVAEVLAMVFRMKPGKTGL